MSQKIKIKLAVLISDAGTGTNLQAIIDGIEAGKINAEIIAVISDKVDAPGLDRARKHNSNERSFAPAFTKIKPKKKLNVYLFGRLETNYIR